MKRAAAGLGRVGRRFEEHLLKQLAPRVSRTFEYMRSRQIQLVIDSSPYLSVLAKRDRRRAHYKALQAIRRSPSLDRPDIIRGDERRVLEVVRSQLYSQHWTLYRESDIEQVLLARWREDGYRRLGRLLQSHLAYKLSALATSSEPDLGGFDSQISLVFPRLRRCTAAAVSLLLYYDRSASVSNVEALTEVVRGSVDSNVPLTLVYFACLASVSIQAASRSPENYMPFFHSGTRLQRHRQAIKNLVYDLQLIGVRHRLVIILADTDGPAYVFPVISRGLDEREFWRRTRSHCANLVRQNRWIKDLPVPCGIYRWSTIQCWMTRNSMPPGRIGQELVGIVKKKLSADDIRGESLLLANEFSMGPAESGLRRSEKWLEMAARKSALYAMQGDALSSGRLFHFPIWLQGERPEDRRGRMYSVLACASGRQLAIICPWAA